MRLGQFSLLIFILVFACNPYRSSDKQLELSKRQLSGEWEQIGLFNHDKPIFDTIYYKFSNTDSIIDKIIYGIWTDSGKYEHVYSAATQAFLRADTVSQIAVHNFIFQTDSSGIIEHYNVQINQTNSKDMVYTSNFRVLKKDSLTYIEFENKNGEKDTAKVSLLADKLELQWSEQVKEIFIRLGSK